MIDKLFFEIYKNFKIIFRNWSSLILIIIAPLILILLVGYSFSGDTIHDINVGIISEGGINLEEFSKNISSFGEITEYGSVNDCITELALQKNHICIEITGNLDLSKKEIPTGEVNFYYDNTRKQISIVLLSQVKDFFGITSEKISLISTQELFNNLEELFLFLNQRISDVEKARNESEKILTDLIERRDKIVEIRDEFHPRYVKVKNLQKEIQIYEDDFNNKSSEFLGSINELNSLIFNSTNSSVNITEIANITQPDFNFSGNVQEIIEPLDLINKSLEEEIASANQYIYFINESMIELDNILTESEDKLEALALIDPSLAEKIVKPITQTLNAVVSNLKEIQLAFPILLLTVAIFISVIFSNILTSIEINNDAYARNLIAPIDDVLFVIGMAITNFIIVLFQIIVLFIVAQTRFNVDVISKLGSLAPIILFLVFMFVFIGMLIAYLARNPQTSILLATFIALGFFLFSDGLNALEAMPLLAAKIAAFNPVVIVNGMLRQIMFFDIPLTNMLSSLYLIGVYCGVAFLVLIIVSKLKNKQRF